MELYKVPLISGALAAEAPPVVPPVGIPQLKVVPEGTIPSLPLTGVIEKLSPLQMVLDIFVIAGFGFTVMVTVKGVPVQPPPVGVTVYLAVRALLVVLVSVPLIDAAPLPETPPVIPIGTAGADQL